MTITEFLLARIAEDEAQARELLRDLEGEVGEEYAGAVDERGPMTPKRLLSAQMWAHFAGQSKRRSFARGQQIAYLANPARMLAECAAKRAIIERHPIHVYQGINGQDVPECAVGDGFPCDTLQALAAVYADHPDYQQGWAL